MTTSTTNLVADATRNYYELGRLQVMDQWWHWLVLTTVCVAIVVWIAVLYRRDSTELRRGTRWLLVCLRGLAFVGLLVFFLNLEKRTERKLVKNSRVVMLVDTSQSMALVDGEATAGGEAGGDTGGVNRIDPLIAELNDGTLLDQLRQKHDVVVCRFDQQDRPVEVAVMPKVAPVRDRSDSAVSSGRAAAASRREARWLMITASLLLLIALGGGAAHWLLGRRVFGEEGRSWALLLSVIALVFAAVTMAVCNLRNPHVSLASVFGTVSPDSISPDPVSDPPPDVAPRGGADSPTSETIVPADWKTALAPRGAETRLGDALRFMVDKERVGPVAGIVLVTDGRSNAGIECGEAIDAAQDAEIALYPVGMGSPKRPANVRVVDLEAPRRVYPGDHFTITGYLQATALEGRTVTVELSSAAAGSDGESDEIFEAERRVQLGATGEVLPVAFDVAPSEQGRRSYIVRVTPPREDRDAKDNQRAANIEIVDRRNRVLLIAGGPTREFRFLRNLLFRDRETTVDVWLQTSTPGASQEANRLLDDFPSDSKDMFEYDCVVAFDPDWEQLDGGQIELLERWVAEQAGGLILVAGPVYTDQWSGRRRGDAKLDTLKALYPVVFFSRASSALGASYAGSERPWPLQFTDDGLQADFLWLDDTQLLSEEAWSSFAGVYGYCTIRGAKPGADVYARFSDPQTTVDGELPVYLAGQFYGAGRTFFQASGEMWRLREVDPKYFEQYYIKLIRYASQGRLLRDSARGVLLVDKDRCLLGDSVVVRASLTDAQFQPLKSDEVAASLRSPSGSRQPLPLRRVLDAAREGTYAGQFTAMEEGDYRIELALLDAADDVVLTREVRVRVPDLEIEQPERDDAVLSEMARRTGGDYYVGIPAAMGRRGVPPLASVMVPQDQETYLSGTPDRDFEQRLMTWLLGLICGVLFVEWLVRRLNRLA